MNESLVNSINIYLYIHGNKMEIENVLKYEKNKKIFKFQWKFVYDP